jgi:two-component system chemotaxis response regulator CheY
LFEGRQTALKAAAARTILTMTHQHGEKRQSQDWPAEASMLGTVIIADDAAFMRAMLRDIITPMGLDVVAEAADGAEAVALHAQLQPTLTLLDVTMPGMDGVEAARRIMASDPAATIVMISALGQKDQVLAAVKAGALDFVIKPFEPDRVEETLRQVLTRLDTPVS